MYSKKQEEAALAIEIFSQQVLEALKFGEEDVDMEPLMQAIEVYSSFPESHMPDVERWQQRLVEISGLVETERDSAELELRALVNNGSKINAYNKALSIKPGDKV